MGLSLVMASTAKLADSVEEPYEICLLSRRVHLLLDNTGFCLLLEGHQRVLLVVSDPQMLAADLSVKGVDTHRRSVPTALLSFRNT